MKILQVIPRFNPILGGGVNVVYNISRALAKRGHEVTIITTKCNFNEKTADEIRNFGVEVIPFDYLFDLHLFIPSPSIKKWLSENIRDFDVIHLNGARSYQNNIVLKYANKYKVPYILQPHGSILRIIDIKPLKLIYDLIWGNDILMNSSRIIALHKREVEQIKSRGISENKIDIVPNGIDLLEFSDLPPRGRFREKHNIRMNTKIILFLGRIHKIKGINLLIEAFSELNECLVDTMLVIVGRDDGLLDSLQKQVVFLKLTDNVLFTGPLFGNEKIEAFNDADVYVLPSIYDTFPLTIMEACACGIPIVTTDRCGIADIVKDSVGYVVEYNSYQLKQALIDILTDPDLRKNFGMEGKILVKEKFNWSKIVVDLEKTYQNAINIDR